MGGPALRGAATAASGEAGIVLSPPVGAAGGAGGRTVRAPRGGGEERDALGEGRAAQKGREREEEEALKDDTFPSQARKAGESMAYQKTGPTLRPTMSPGQRREDDRSFSKIAKGRRFISTATHNRCLTAKAFIKALENIFWRGLRAN